MRFFETMPSADTNLLLRYLLYLEIPDYEMEDQDLERAIHLVKRAEIPSDILLIALYYHTLKPDCELHQILAENIQDGSCPPLILQLLSGHQVHEEIRFLLAVGAKVATDKGRMIWNAHTKSCTECDMKGDFRDLLDVGPLSPSEKTRQQLESFFGPIDWPED